MSRLVTLWVVCLAACGGADAEIGLEARQVEDRSAHPAFVPVEAGSRLVAVQIRLLDATPSPLSLAHERFSLELDRGDPQPGHALTAVFGDGCAGAVEPGTTATCWVGFEIPSASLPSRIVYEHEGRRVAARVSVRADGGPPIPPGDAGLPEPTNQLDLLLAIDNSGSLTEEQASFSAELPRLIRALVTGDVDDDGRLDGPDDVEPLDLHVAVITSDMGSGGFTVPTCAHSNFGDDGVLRSAGRTDIAGCMADYPSFMTFAPGGGADVEAFSRDVTCVSTVGTGGCGFEQQLESALKALSPSAPTAAVHPAYQPPTFFRGTPGQGDGANAGFLRPDSVLAIVLLSDEEDCSTRDPALFDTSPDGPYGRTDLNLRCFAHQEEALHPLDRYVDGFVQLRRSVRRLVYLPIAGIPADLEPPPGGRPSWDRLVSEDPALRDDRMEERVDPAMPSRLQPSCNVPGRGVAFAPVRIVRVAQRLERVGAHVSVGSICQESFAPSTDQLIRLIGLAARGE